MTLHVQRAGFLTTVQDLGRVGYRHIGVSLGGALDPHALRVVNLLVGNVESAAGLEFTQGRAQFTAERRVQVAWAGGAYAVRAGSRVVPPGRVATLTAGEQLEIAGPTAGARAWIALSGGIDVPQVLGSRSTDVRTQFGGHNGRPLRDGDVLPLASASAESADTRSPSRAAPHDWVQPRRRTLRFVRGRDWAAMRGMFGGAEFGISPQSDRMGARLTGGKLQCDRELLSEAVAPGTIQLPPSGEPVLLLNDCQTIGGYAKIAHVITVDLGAAAQLAGGETVRFEEVPCEIAEQLLATRGDQLRWFRAGLTTQGR